MKKSEFLLLADKFINGTLSEAEQVAFDTHCDHLESLVPKWDPSCMDDQEAVRQRVFQEIEKQAHGRQPNAIRLYGRWFAIAASVLMAFWLGFSFRNKLYNQLFPVHMLAAAAGEGKSVRLRLPDGSMVWLNEQSSLTFPDDFRDSSRSVILVGEAYFDVAHDEEKPFVIQSSNLATRVLGTRFVVKSYLGDVLSKVTVLDGKVSVSTAGQKMVEPVVLMPEQQLVADTRSGKIVVADHIDSLSAMSWTTGKLTYRNAPLGEVIDDLERRYKVTIVPDAHLANCLIYADFKAGDPLLDVLELLAVSLSGNMERSAEKVYRLHGKECK